MSESGLRGAPTDRRGRLALAAVEVDQTEACGLEQATRHLVLLAGDVTLTSPVWSAFHCARRLRVFARDILRLGTAMIELSS